MSKSDIQEKEISKATLVAKNEKEKRIRIEKSSKLLEIKINNLILDYFINAKLVFEFSNSAAINGNYFFGPFPK